ncbi:MOSC domain-containing protein [Octadecabacter sp.]|nr:MOSC domain-containing protein [Octadecabacter sp.]
MGGVAELWRHPIKSHGREALNSIDLKAGQSMPWDRHWAVTHEATKFAAHDPKWVMCRNFMITAATPSLAGIWTTFDETSGQMTLSHVDRPTFSFNPSNPDDIPDFIEWVTPLCPPEKRQPKSLITSAPRGMTDSDYPSISIMTKASHAAVETQLGHPLAHERWRGNIWLDGTVEWDEMGWVGKDLRIGSAVLTIKEPIQRCMATAANPETGQRDVDTLGALRDGWDHQYFGVYAIVKSGGTINVGDSYEVL